MTALAGHAEPTAQMPARVGCNQTCLHVPTHQKLCKGNGGLLPSIHMAYNQAKTAAPCLYLERDCFCYFTALDCCIKEASGQLNGPHGELQVAVALGWQAE